MKKLIITLLILNIISSVFAQNEQMYIFLLAGQSNMAGRANITPLDTVTYPNIYCLNKNLIWEKAKNPLHYDVPGIVGVGPGLNFAKGISEMFGDSIKIGLVPCAVGGTSIEQWLNNSVVNGTYLYSNLLNRANYSRKSGKIVGVVWHQGEQNALPKNYNNYKEKLKPFIRKLRLDLNNENLLFISGELGTFLDPATFQTFPDSINLILHSLKKDLLDFDVVCSSGLTDKGDKLHFDSPSQRELGSRYAASWIKKSIKIALSDTTLCVGRILSVPIRKEEIIAIKGMAYQFDYSYDYGKLEYIGNSLTGTIAEGGNVSVNATEAGILIVNFTTATPISGTGKIINLYFKVIGEGVIASTITNFKYDKLDISSITNGVITAKYLFGDIVANDKIDTYDAILALQYSVNLDPLPSIDPLPWEAWRSVVADVDGINGVSAMDASLIMQYSVGIIKQFPIECKSQTGIIGDVTITVENREIVFRSSGEIFGLNLSVQENFSILGTPIFPDVNMISSSNINETSYAIGLATAYSPAVNAILMRIPLSGLEKGSVTFDLIVNNVKKYFTVDLTTGIVNVSKKFISVYPNPATNELFLKNVGENSEISIYDMTGKVQMKFSIDCDRINISNLANGIYTIKISDRNNIRMFKFVKH